LAKINRSAEKYNFLVKRALTIIVGLLYLQLTDHANVSCRLYQRRKEDIRNEFSISPSSEKMNARITGKHICRDWNTPAFHYRHISTIRKTRHR
jgi:hypothetical protein